MKSQFGPGAHTIYPPGEDTAMTTTVNISQISAPTR